MAELIVLNLGDNQIKEVENGAFKGLTKLKLLYLHRNQIEKIASGAFEGTHEYVGTFLIRQDNQISTFSKFTVFVLFQSATKSNI
jgi:Leucine-rich repeat (LRR) protein